MTRDSKHRMFQIKLTYFKNTGKLYADGSLAREFAECGPEGGSVCYMDEVVTLVRELRAKRELPGLNGGWDGYIVADCDEGYPCLITPGPACEAEVKVLFPGVEVTKGGSLFDGGQFLAWAVKDREINLDGGFTVEQLEGLAWWMRVHGRAK